MKKFTVLISAVMFIAIIASTGYASTIHIQGTIPEGRVGQYYSARFTATSTATSHIRNWNFRGTIPGLTFSGLNYTGMLSGTPSATGRSTKT